MTDPLAERRWTAWLFGWAVIGLLHAVMADNIPPGHYKSQSLAWYIGQLRVQMDALRTWEALAKCAG